jgi:hypothetical protein
LGNEPLGFLMFWNLLLTDLLSASEEIRCCMQLV